uniref:Uncharacterized protein n=2 Tax=Oryza nivara TaxID=4536 RepID=A0A0E0HXJ4_ORYNI
MSQDSADECLFLSRNWEAMCTQAGGSKRRGKDAEAEWEAYSGCGESGGRGQEVVFSATRSEEVRARSVVPGESKSVEALSMCKAMLFVYARNKSETKGSSSGATVKLAAQTHFIEHIFSVLDFLSVLYCGQTNKKYNKST